MHKATAREIDAELVVAQGTASLRQADFENPIGTIDDVDRLDGAICLGQGIEHDAQLGCVHPRLTADIVSQEAKMRRKFRDMFASICVAVVVPSARIWASTPALRRGRRTPSSTAMSVRMASATSDDSPSDNQNRSERDIIAVVSSFLEVGQCRRTKVLITDGSQIGLACRVAGGVETYLRLRAGKHAARKNDLLQGFWPGCLAASASSTTFAASKAVMPPNPGSWPKRST